jgi:hypothetical protein
MVRFKGDNTSILIIYGFLCGSIRFAVRVVILIILFAVVSISTSCRHV